MATEQRGVALITALLVVAIATLAATALLSASESSLLRTASLRDTEQGWWYAQGVEDWVRGILDQSVKKNPNYDGFDQPWAVPVSNLPVDEGSACGRIVDQQGLFNLNNLVAPNAAPYIVQFNRLLTNLDVTVPAGLIDAIVDWADADDVPTPPDGAEDMNYLGLTPPYRTANRPFTAVSELLAVQGMTPDIYRVLTSKCGAGPLPETCITALPTLGTLVNVNTAPEAVLAALSGTVNQAALDQWVKDRLEKPVQDRNAFFGNSNALGADAKDYVDVRSNYFLLQGDIFIGSGHVALYSLIYRQPSSGTTILSRSTVPELTGSPPCATPSTSN